MPSKRAIQNRLDQLERENGGDGHDITITETVVHQDGSEEVLEEARIWQDDQGKWHSETTEYDVVRDWSV